MTIIKPTLPYDLTLVETPVALKLCVGKHDMAPAVTYGSKVREYNRHGVALDRFQKFSLMRCRKCPYEQIFEITP